MTSNKSISTRLRSTLRTETRREIMQQWSANISSRTEELIDLLQLAAERGDLDEHREYCRELYQLITRSMSAVPRITDILINTEPERGE